MIVKIGVYQDNYGGDIVYLHIISHVSLCHIISYHIHIISYHIIDKGDIDIIKSYINDNNNKNSWIICKNDKEARDILLNRISYMNNNLISSTVSSPSSYSSSPSPSSSTPSLPVSEDDFTMIQDLDVLDTWFSSSLTPLTAFNWDKDKMNGMYIISYHIVSYHIISYHVIFCPG